MVGYRKHTQLLAELVHLSLVHAGKLSDPLVAHAVTFCFEQQVVFQLLACKARIQLCLPLELMEEPWVEAGDLVDILQGVGSADNGGIGGQQPERVGAVQEVVDFLIVVAGVLQVDQPLKLALAGTDCLVQRFQGGTSERKGFADTAHLRAERAVGKGKFLQFEAGHLDGAVVQSWLIAACGLAGDFIQDLVQRVADGKLGGATGNREAGRLACQGGGAGYARVHLDDHHAPVLRVDGKLDVAAAAIHTDGTENRY